MMSESQRGRRLLIGWWGAGAGEGLLRRLLRVGGGAVLEGVLGGDPRSLGLAKQVLNPKQLQQFEAFVAQGLPHWTQAAADIEARLAALSAVALLCGDPDYPQPLAFCPDNPPVLSVRGHLKTLNKTLVAVVGTRRTSPEGRALCQRLVSAVIERWSVGVVSGGARGIDAIAHREALARQVPQVLVCGTGIDGVYPFEHRQLFDAIIDQGGAVVSQFPPGQEVHPAQFPRRNATISGLATAVVVVEAPLESGALHTVNSANRQGRPAFVASGPALHAGFTGGLAAVQAGHAKLLHQLDDLSPWFQTLPCAPKPPQTHQDPKPTQDAKRREAQNLSAGLQLGLFAGGPGAPADVTQNPLFKVILDAIDAHPHGAPRDTLLSLGDPKAMNQHLMELQLQGVISREPGDIFRRLPS